jgi:TRIAD3 protein (E3 ubiquitin-protein ligase RNF216)
MAPFDVDVDHDIIDLLSDSDNEDDGFVGQELDFFDAQSAAEFAQDFPDFEDQIAGIRAPNGVDDHETIDLTGIPDIDVPPSDPIMVEDDAPQSNTQAPDWIGDAQVVTEAACLQMVTSVLPDISVDYVLKLIQEKMTDETRTMAQCEHFLTELLEGEPYPREADEAKKKKRKREDEAEDDTSNYEKDGRDEIGGYEHDA